MDVLPKILPNKLQREGISIKHNMITCVPITRWFCFLKEAQALNPDFEHAIFTGVTNNPQLFMRLHRKYTLTIKWLHNIFSAFRKRFHHIKGAALSREKIIILRGLRACRGPVLVGKKWDFNASDLLKTTGLSPVCSAITTNSAARINN